MTRTGDRAPTLNVNTGRDGARIARDEADAVRTAFLATVPRGRG